MGKRFHREEKRMHLVGAGKRERLNPQAVRQIMARSAAEQQPDEETLLEQQLLDQHTEDLLNERQDWEHELDLGDWDWDGASAGAREDDWSDPHFSDY